MSNENITLTKSELQSMIQEEASTIVKQVLKGVASENKVPESPQEKQLKAIGLELCIQAAQRDMMKARKYGARSVARAYQKSIEGLADLF